MDQNNTQDDTGEDDMDAPGLKMPAPLQPIGNAMKGWAARHADGLDHGKDKPVNDALKMLGAGQPYKQKD